MKELQVVGAPLLYLELHDALLLGFTNWHSALYISQGSLGMRLNIGHIECNFSANAKAVITATCTHLGGKVVPLKQNVDKAVLKTSVEFVLVSSSVHKLVPVTQFVWDIPLEKVRSY